MSAKIAICDKKEAVNDGYRKEAELREEELFEMRQMPLLYNTVSNPYQQNHWRKSFEHTSAVEQAAHFLRKESPFSKVIENLNDICPGEINSKHVL